MALDDPVRIIEDGEQRNSLIKFTADLFSQSSTAQLVYTNDLKVLIDVTIRQLLDLSADDRVRVSVINSHHRIPVWRMISYSVPVVTSSISLVVIHVRSNDWLAVGAERILMPKYENRILWMLMPWSIGSC